MRTLLLCVAVVFCLVTATLANEQQQQQEETEVDRQQEELHRNMLAMDLLASQTQAAADRFRSEQRLRESIEVSAQPEHAQQHQQDQKQHRRDNQMHQLDQQEQHLHDLELRTSQMSGPVPATTLNETIFTEPFLLPMHQSLQIPHCFTPGSECTLAFWVWVSPQEELLDHSQEHSLVCIITSNLPPELLSPSLLLGVAPKKMHPFLSIKGSASGALVGVFSDIEIESDRWVHLTLSLDQHALSLFVNGRRTAIVPFVDSTPPTCSSSMIERGRSPPTNEHISIVGNDHASGDVTNPFGWTADGCEQCRLWPFNTTLGFGGNRATPGADAVIARAVLYNTKMDDSGSHPAVMDMNAMKRSRKQGSGPLVLKFPLVQQNDGDDSDEDSTEDLPIVLSNEITEAGNEAMFVSGHLLSNFLNATGGSSYMSPALPLLGVAFQHLLPSELREVTLPPPLPVHVISSLPFRPPLPPGAGFITVSANTEAEFLPLRSRGSAHIDFRRATAYYGTLAERSVGTLLDADGVQVQFLDLEDIDADPEGSSLHGEQSDEIIYHRSQAEAGNADSQAWLGTQLYWGAMGLERNQVEAVRWLEAAAAQNQPDALYNMAVMHAYGHGGAAQDNQLAREYFERAAALDFAPAKNGLAMLLSNSGGEEEYQEAFKLFNESAALGNSDGHFNKGILLRQGLGVAKDPVAARVALQAAADLGHPTACVTLAEMLVSGEGGPDDHIGALVLLKLISEMGKTGRALNDGIKSFVDNNVTEAIRLLTPLAAVGYEVAQLNLAYIYKEKLGRTDLAIPALRLAAGQGSPKALVILGNLAYWGTGIEANATHSLQLFAAAARSDSAHGAFNCGMMYLLGDGVASDHNQARLWFQKARKLDEDAELPCFLALNFVLPLMRYPTASDLLHSISKSLFSMFMQHQGEGALWSMPGSNVYAAFSDIELGGPAFQRILWMFVLSLLLPWFFLFFHGGRNLQPDQQDQHAQLREQQDEVRVPN